MSDRDRFDKFTERARKVLSLAQEEAQRLQHNYIGTEHLLLGLVSEGEGVAAKVLSALGVELNKLRGAIEFIISRGDRIVPGQIGLTPRAKKVMELAVDEARRLNHHYIGTEHLLLGLIREGEGIAAGVLESLGVNLEKARTQTIQILSQVGVSTTIIFDEEMPTVSPPPQTSSGEESRDRFDKFTERARKVLSLAQEEAQRFQHNYIGTEHLLLGLVREGEGVAAKVLSSLGVELNRVRSAVEFIIGRGDRIVLGEIALTPRAKKVVELAVDEARRLNHHYIGTEHLLLGLVREGEGIAAGALESLGVNLERVRVVTIQVLSSGRSHTTVAGWTSDASTSSAPVADTSTPLPYTEGSRKVLTFAQEEARHFQHDYLGTEHLLLGLIREGEGIAAQVLRSLGVEQGKVDATIEFISGHGTREQTDSADVALTLRASEVLGLATFEARRLNHNYVATEHLLLGLARAGESVAAAILQSMGVKLEQVQKRVMEMIQPG